MLFLLTACSKSPEGPVDPTPQPKPEDTRTLREKYSASTDAWPEAEWYTDIVQRELEPLPSNPFANPDPAMLQLGKVLFFEKRMGSTQNSCSSCHEPSKFWTDGKKVATGGGVRNTPTMGNAWSLKGHLFHDGRAATYAEQITIAIESPVEMAGDLNLIPWQLSQISGYPPLFEAAFGTGTITRERILEALEVFSKSISSGETAYDRFLQGDYAALTDQQIEGLHLFRTKAKCINCHNGPFLTDLDYHNLGYAIDFRGQFDNGRFDATGLEEDKGKIRTPTLRNVANTAPYWHNGEVATLVEAIDLLNSGMPHTGRQKINGTLSQHIRRLDLDAGEKKAIIAFLNTLSSEAPNIQAPELPQ